MIIKKFITGLSMPFNLLASKTEAIAISIPTPVDRGDFCWCSRVCPPQMVVFAGTSDLTTDKSSFIYPAATGADPFKIELFKNGAKVADLNNETYGNYFVFVTNDGSFAHGVVLNWGLVYASFGSGSYEVIAEVITVGQTIDYNSGEFNLMPFSEEAADQTVRIETWQNGRIESSPIDFTGLNWYSQIRLEGTMKERVPELVSSNYKDSLRNIKQIQDSVLDTWTLELFDLTGVQKNALIYEALLSNRIVVTDYSLDNDERYTAQEVVGDVIEAVNYRINEPGNSVVLKLKSRKEDILKRNTIFDTVVLGGGGGANVCPNAYVTLDGLPYLELFAGQTVNIFVLNSQGQAVSANVNGNNLTLPDVPISVNAVNEGDLVAQNPVSVNLSDGTDPITPTNVTLTGNVLDIEVQPWVRPSDWLPMPSVTDTDDTFVGLYAIHPSGNNFAAFRFTTSAGQYRVDWGDGTIDLVNSNVTAEHTYDYAAYDPSNSTLTTRGYKQAMITVTAVSGDLLTSDFQFRRTTVPAQNTVYSTGFLDCILTMPNASAGGSITFAGVTVRHTYVERFSLLNIGGCTLLQTTFRDCLSLQSVFIGDTSSVTDTIQMFNVCYSLKQVPLFDTSSVTRFQGMFTACHSLVTVPLFDVSSGTNFNQMFQNCFSLKEVPLFAFNTALSKGMSNMFSTCRSLRLIPLFNTANTSVMNSMFNGCSSLQSIPLLDTSDAETMDSMFNGCTSLEYIPALSTASVNTSFDEWGFSGGVSLNRCDVSFNFSISLINCQLSQAELVNIFNNLAVVVGQTINITGNWGASALTPAERDIALLKGWTITG